jgi:hypothetical protein
VVLDARRVITVSCLPLTADPPCPVYFVFLGPENTLHRAVPSFSPLYHRSKRMNMHIVVLNCGTQLLYENVDVNVNVYVCMWV